jgi:hypothetical protein
MYKIIDNFLTEEDFLNYQNMFSRKSIQQISSFCTGIPKYINQKYRNKLDECGITSLDPSLIISICDKPIYKHQDKNLNNEKYKLLLYLNEVPNGGTILYIDDKEVLVENKLNRLLIFDISLYHKSEEFSTNYIKRTIGFRGFN